MIKEVAKIEDFKKIAKEHKHFLWHFLQKDQEETNIAIFSYFEKTNKTGVENILHSIIDNIDIPYFESYTEESIDFLIESKIDSRILYKPQYDPTFYLHRKHYYTPMLVGFNHYNKISSTLDYCYCVEGACNVIADLDPKYLLGLSLD